MSKLNNRGDRYLLRAKFTNDLDFFVREVGRESFVLECSLELLRGDEGDDEDRKPVWTYFGKKFRKFYLACSASDTIVHSMINEILAENYIAVLNPWETLIIC